MIGTILLLLLTVAQLGHCHFHKMTTTTTTTTGDGHHASVPNAQPVNPDATYQNQNRRSTLEVDPPTNFIDIQRQWVNWYHCTELLKEPNQSNFETRQYFAPLNYVFTSYANQCNVTNEKKGTIGTGTKTLVFPIDVVLFFGQLNDWELGLCGTNESSQVEPARFAAANDFIAQQKAAEFKANLYSRVDGSDFGHFFIMDNRTNFLDECPGKELCGPDTCDATPNVTCKGLDAYPMFGWFATDTRTWRNGDTHVYEVGITNTSGPACSRTKFVITAVGEDPVTKSPTQSPIKKTSTPCGLFRLGIVCLNGCGWIGRLLKLCKE